MPAPNFIGGLSIGNRFWHDRLGVMLAGSIQNIFRGTERTYNSVKMASGEQAMYISSLQHRYYSIHDLTAGAHAKLDLTLGNHKLEWYNMYVRTRSQGIRYNNSISTEYIGDDTYTQDDETRSSSQTQSIFATNLKGTHRLTRDFTLDWSGIFSQAKEEDPDRTYVTLTNTVQATEGVDGSLWSSNKNIQKTLPKSAERRYQHNKDTDWAGYINLSYDTHFGNGMDAQLAASYTGTKLALVSPFKDADQWDKAMFSLDLSAEKQFKNGISVFLKANNLLDAKRERYLKTVNKSNLEYEGQTGDKTIVGTYKYGRTFLLGVRYKL